MADKLPNIVSRDDAKTQSFDEPPYWSAKYASLTPHMKSTGGRLGVNQITIPPGKVACPFHAHQREDEVFYILSGRGVFRYGETLQAVGAGDCISCPAKSGHAHQLANPFDEDLVYLAIGNHDPDEVCTYPDSGKVLIRSLKQVGVLDERKYMDGESGVEPKIFSAWRSRENPKA